MNFLELPMLRHPLIQAPMAGVQGADLAVAVSEAGGLGSLPGAMLGPEQLQAELESITRRTDKPYNVNFFCHRLPTVDDRREARWQECFSSYYREFSVEPPKDSGPGRRPFDSAIADVIEPFKPPVVSFHFGFPDPALVARVKAWGSRVISSATTVAEARWLEAHGADGIIAQGLEAGGHRGMFLTDDLATQVGTLSLVPQVVSAVNVPVIAAGGIADARGVAAAMALGASGVQVGTAYLQCPEALTSAVHRAALASEDSVNTAITNVFTGRPARSIVNRVVRELGPINSGAPDFPRAASAIAPITARAESAGSGDFSPLWAGQNTAGCEAVPAAQITRKLAHGFGGSR